MATLKLSQTNLKPRPAPKQSTQPAQSRLKPPPKPNPTPKLPLIDIKTLGQVFIDGVPLAIGMREQLYQAYPELSRKRLRKAMRKHVNRYRPNLKPGMSRFNLDGSVSGKVTELECSTTNNTIGKNLL